MAHENNLRGNVQMGGKASWGWGQEMNWPKDLVCSLIEDLKYEAEEFGLHPMGKGTFQVRKSKWQSWYCETITLTSVREMIKRVETLEAANWGLSSFGPFREGLTPSGFYFWLSCSAKIVQILLWKTTGCLPISTSLSHLSNKILSLSGAAKSLVKNVQLLQI